MNHKIIKNVLYVSLAVCILYLVSKITYTAYKSDVDLQDDIYPRAAWTILIDNKQVTNISARFIKIDDVSWNNISHVESGKIAVGSTGSININLNATSSEVAVAYKFKFIDKSIDSAKYLTVNNVTCTNCTLDETDVGEYSGILSLTDLENNLIPNILVNVEWVDDGDIEYNFDDDLDDTSKFLEIQFEARQYRGE